MRCSPRRATTRISSSAQKGKLKMFILLESLDDFYVARSSYCEPMVIQEDYEFEKEEL